MKSVGVYSNAMACELSRKAKSFAISVVRSLMSARYD